MAISSPFVATGAFIAGVALIVYSVEELIETLTKAAVVTGLSTFMLAVVFAGLDFENWAFGVASMLGELPGIAVGSALGSGVFLVGVAVAFGGVFTPFEPTVDTDYLVLLLVSPLVLLVFILDGVVSRFDGVALLVLFGVALAYMYRAERRGRETFRDEEAEEAVEAVEEEGHGGWYYLALSAVFVVGIVIGSEMAVRGARGIVTAFGLNQTVFGMTFVGLAMSLEEVSLVVAPVREGRASIAVGNIVGSMIFFATGNIGLLAVTRTITLDPSVLTFYWPAYFGATLLIGAFLYRGRIERPEAIVLGILYIAFWVGSYLVV